VFAYHNVGARCLRVLLAHGVEVPLVVTHADDPGETLWFERVADVANDYGIAWIAPDDAGASDAYARITLPDGKHVTVLERHADSAQSPDQLIATFAQVGVKVLLQVHGPTWFAVGTDMGNAGLGVQCETWDARPGVSLGVEEPVDAAGYKTFVRICASLAAP